MSGPERSDGRLHRRKGVQPAASWLRLADRIGGTAQDRGPPRSVPRSVALAAIKGWVGATPPVVSECEPTPMFFKRMRKKVVNPKG